MSESPIDADKGQRREQPVTSTFSESFDAKPALERLDILEEAAAALCSAAEATHDVAALRQVVDLCERAVQAAPVESVRHGLAVYNLFSVLGTLYAWTREHALRQRAADLAKVWLDSPEAPRDGREPQYLLSLGAYLYRVALATSERKDIDAAIQVLEGARSFVKTGTPVDCTAAAFLADIHLDQYRRTAIPTELRAAIELSAIPIASKRSRIELRQLGLKVFSRAMVWSYEELSANEDLELALDSARTGMQEATTDRDRMEFLSVIATALRYRFKEAKKSE